MWDLAYNRVESRAEPLTDRTKCGKLLIVSERALPALTAERRAAAAEMVAQRGAARVAELAERFEVSTATIRRDLEALEEQGVLRRVHGGAVAVEKAAQEDAAPSAAGTEEARIGQAVVEMMADGETVFLGPGRLPLAVAQRLNARSRITVVTNGLEVAHWLASNTPHTLIVTGGQAEGRDMELAGQLTKTALSSLRADSVILELGGASAVEGLTHDSLPQAEIARLLLETGSRVVILVSAERMGRVAAAYVGAATDADVIVTGREAPSPFLWDLSEAGVRIVLA